MNGTICECTDPTNPGVTVRPTDEQIGFNTPVSPGSINAGNNNLNTNFTGTFRDNNGARYDVVKNPDGSYTLTDNNKCPMGCKIDSNNKERYSQVESQYNRQYARSGNNNGNGGGSGSSSGRGSNQSVDNTATGCHYNKLGGYSCDITSNAIDNAQTVNAVAQTLGSTLVNTVGQNSVNRAQVTGTASDTFRGAADA